MKSKKVNIKLNVKYSIIHAFMTNLTLALVEEVVAVPHFEDFRQISGMVEVVLLEYTNKKVGVAKCLKHKIKTHQMLAHLF